MSEHLRPAEKQITESDEFIAAQLEGASIPTLMMSLVHLTGDSALLQGPIRPKVVMMGGFQGALSEEDQATVRRQALKALKDYRDRGCTLPAQPSAAVVQEMMNFMVGERVGDEYVPMMLEELALDGNDSRAPSWSREVPASVRDKFHVLVIGAGMSGLLQALRLKEAGIPFTVVEKNDSVGGTWYENRYPGCRVDIANHFYSYSFEPYPWSEYFSRRDELLEYFRSFVTRHGLAAHIRLNTEVTAARYTKRVQPGRSSSRVMAARRRRSPSTPSSAPSGS